jgi:hypothetical protein
VCTQLCGAACDVSNTTYPTRTGRIGMGKTSRKSITPHDRLWAEVVEYRFSNRIASEAEAVRRLIQAGLTAARRAVSAPRRDSGEAGRPGRRPIRTAAERQKGRAGRHRALALTEEHPVYHRPMRPGEDRHPTTQRP